MNYEIQQYKSQLIEYDDEIDKFVCDITIEDRTKTSKRSSLKELRKEIDTFVKLNLEFKKFKLFQKRSYNNEFEIINVDGIRTDGRFTCRNEEHPTRGYDLVDFKKEIKEGDNFYIYDAEVVKEKMEIKYEEQEYRKIINQKEKNLLKKMKKFDLEAVKRYTDAFAKS